jgi:tetratricopeptide (TPR) repeat protein
LAESYVALREFDSAIYYGNQALRLSGSDESKENLADIYYEAMSFSLDQNSATNLGNSAREIYEGLLEGQSGRLDLMNKMAMTYVVSEAPMKGIMMLRQVLEKDANNEDAIFNLGVLSIQSGQYDKGVQRFQKLIEIDSTNVKAYYFLGLCLKESDKPAEAKVILNKALSLGDNEEVIASINALLQEL